MHRRRLHRPSEIGPDHPEADDSAWESCWSNLFGGDDSLLSVPDSFLPTITTPPLVAQGDDEYHPTSASRLPADSAPGAKLIKQWKDGSGREAAIATIRRFLTGESTL